MVRIFEMVGLQTILNKTKAIKYTPWFIWGQQRDQAYKRQATGEGQTFREMKRIRLPCRECDETMSASSLQHHMERAHDRVLPQVRGVDVGG